MHNNIGKIVRTEKKLYLARNYQQMAHQLITRRLLLLLTIFATIICDQATKYWARQTLTYHDEIPVIGRYFVLIRTENSGAFLSLGDSAPYYIRITFLTILPCLVLVLGLYYLMRSKENARLMAFGIALALGGGMGNLYDRIVHGSVTDFMYMDFTFARTGIFNVADVAIMIGMAFILWHSFFKRKATAEKPLTN